MPNMLAARAALIARITDGPGEASAVERRAALDNHGLAEPLAALVRTIAERAHAVTDADFARAIQAGRTQDQLFELAICAAVGEATRQHDAALAALEAACTGRQSDASRDSR